MSDWRNTCMTVGLYTTAALLAIAAAWLLGLSGRRLVLR